MSRGRAWLPVALLVLVSLLAAVPGPSSAGTPRPPINIYMDGEFTAEHGVVGGSGTPADPFVIEGWEIEIPQGTFEAVRFSWTRAHVVLRNLQIRGWGSGMGISFWKVENARIENVTVTNARQGFYLESVRDVSVVSSTVTDSNVGLWVKESSNGTIASNRFEGDRWGVYLDKTSGYTVYGNHFVDGEYPAGDSEGSNLWDNGYPLGGNFWYDYAGDDRCSGPRQDVCPDPDGIGDTPYELYSIVDAYPRLPNAAPPVPAFSFAPQNPIASETVGFNAAASSDPNGAVVAYRWTFGDGWDGYGPYVGHAFEEIGAYEVTLTVEDDGGWRRSLTQTVLVRERITYVPFEHESGFRVPIPQEWQRGTDVRGVELILYGPTLDDVQTVLTVNTGESDAVRENESYLADYASEFLDYLRWDFYNPRFLEPPEFREFSGHLGVVFAIRAEIGESPLAERTAIVVKVALIVSEAHGRFWTLTLVASELRFPILNETYEVALAGFEITAPPPQSNPTIPALLLLLLIALFVGGAIGLSRALGRRRAPRFCSACGAETVQGQEGCEECGGRRPPREPP